MKKYFSSHFPLTTYIEGFKRGDYYSNLNKCIAINILNESLSLTDKLHSIYQILEVEKHSQLDEVFEIHFFDLTKLDVKKMTELEEWLLFIRTEDKEVRKKLAEGNPMIAKANNVMDIFYLNEKERAAYQAAWRYESDRVSMLKETEEKAIETAKNCLTLNINIETISKITGLTQEEIAKLRAILTGTCKKLELPVFCLECFRKQHSKIGICFVPAKKRKIVLKQALI